MQWRILVVDDDQVIADQTAELIRSTPLPKSDENPIVEALYNFDEAFEQLETNRYDVLVLDIRDQSKLDSGTESIDSNGDDRTEADVGLDVYERVRQRQFVPIIFYTAVPGLASELSNPPFVTVVSKQSDVEEVQKAVEAVIDSDLPTIHRALIRHAEKVTMEFMSEFVESHWGDLTSPPRKGDVAHLLSRRLALSLANGGDALAQYLQHDEGIELERERVHPMRYYIVPPIGSWTNGDILRGHLTAPETATAEPPANTVEADGEGRLAGKESWHVILTPACDLVPDRIKAQFVAVAACSPLKDTKEYKDWREAQTREGEVAQDNAKTSEARLKSLMKNRREGYPSDRYHYLPGAWTVPDLVVDFQQVTSIPYNTLGAYERVATLDSPYAEALIETWGRYHGRLGTPDLDIAISLSRLKDS